MQPPHQPPPPGGPPPPGAPPPYGGPPPYPPPGAAPPGYPGFPGQAGQPYYGAPVAPRRSGVPSWVIVVLVVLGGFILMGGVLGVLAIAGVRKYIASAKMAEAKNSLSQIGRDAAMAYERGVTTPRGTSVQRLCPSASRPVPSSVVFISGKKYLSSAADWQVDAPRHAGFACLGFSLTGPQYYMYNYRAHGGSAPGDEFEATATGDLNGDGRTSLFKTHGTISAQGTLDVAPEIQEQDPLE